MLTNFLVLRWSRTKFNISGLFITVPILIFKDLQMFILSTILSILKKGKKKTVLSRLKIKTIFFYRYPQFSRTEFSNKVTASDLLML